MLTAISYSGTMFPVRALLFGRMRVFLRCMSAAYRSLKSMLGFSNPSFKIAWSSVICQTVPEIGHSESLRRHYLFNEI